MKLRWILSCLLLCLSFAAQAADCPAADPARSEAALAALRELGADVSVRSKDGRQEVMVTTDGNWRGGDAGLAHLKDVSGLYKLRLAGEITDAGVPAVAAVCGLTALDLHLIGLTDAGVRALAGLTRLERLNLTYTKVSDTGLESLASLTGLRWLGLSYTRVTKAGMDKLKNSLGNTIIEGNPSR
jgi:Leucine rich repeat